MISPPAFDTVAKTCRPFPASRKFFFSIFLLAALRAAHAENVTDTHFSMARGFYNTNISVEITCATPGVTIRYTTDSSEPDTTKGLLYTRPVEISQTTVLRAAAFKPGWRPSGVGTHTYIFPDNVSVSASRSSAAVRPLVNGSQIREALASLPSIALVTLGRINQAKAVKASVEWLTPDGQPGFQE